MTPAERICAAIEIEGDSPLSLAELREWSRDYLAPYKIATLLQAIENLPRNAMGKVIKSEIEDLFSPQPGN